MNENAWLKRLLLAVLLLGSAAAAAIWVAAFRVKCEGFGCLGLSAMVAVAFGIDLACVIAGVAVLWLRRAEGKVPRWLVVLVAMHAIPLLWFAGRMMLR